MVRDPNRRPECLRLTLNNATHVKRSRTCNRTRRIPTRIAQMTQVDLVFDDFRAMTATCSLLPFLLVEDENAQLRSQALNSDGTPKRPMNAFMIFARRRRPQVSSANQMMRTGEISKILSKEWNTMPMVSN